MISGYYQIDDNDIRRPYIDLDVDFPAPINARLKVSFVVDTGADRTLLSAQVAQDLERRFNFDIRSLEPDISIAGVGGLVDTRRIEATLSQGRHWIETPVLIIDAVPGPNTVTSLLGRDFIDDYALFLERRNERVLLLDDGEAEDFVNIPTGL